MKKAVQGLLAVLFVWVASLSAVRLDTLDATCASENDLVASDGGAVTDSQGAFDYTLTVESWDLTFDPSVLWLDLWPGGGHINIDEESVDFTPQSVNVFAKGCINDDDILISVDGALEDKNFDGNVNAQVWLGNGGASYDEPWPTYIPEAP